MSCRFVFRTLVVVALAVSLDAAAVISVSAHADHDRYMQYEPVQVTLKLRNRSGNPLVFTAPKAKTLEEEEAALAPDELRKYSGMTLEEQRKFLAAAKIKREEEQRKQRLLLTPEERRKLADELAKVGSDSKANCDMEILAYSRYTDAAMPERVKLVTPLEDLGLLATGEAKETTFVLNRYLPLSKPGVYEVEINVRHDRIPGGYFKSQRISFEVVDGATIWETDVGVPVESRSGAIETRKIMLKTLNSPKENIHYLMIRDSKRIFLMTRLARAIQEAPPQAKTDAVSNVHVLFMLDPKVYEYRVYDFRGGKLQRRFYKPGPDIPRLVNDDEFGRVRVVGGKPAIEGTDFSFADSQESKTKQVAPPGAPAAGKSVLPDFGK
jgi:hypothetical protein